LPNARFEDYRRALCILDPYGLHLDWKVIAEAGRMRSADIFLNFPVADINRNVLWRDRKGVAADQMHRMSVFWGDDSWKEAAYRPSPQMSLLGPPEEEKASNTVIAKAFRKRLNEVARFKHVPEPIAMRNSHNAIVYYLFFASQKPVAEEIVRDIFKKYREREGV
jgi:three-Cys-motif partner protein